MNTLTLYEAITELKKRFPLNNPASWSQNSKKQLGEWYAEYILEDTSIKVKWDGTRQRFKY